MSLCVYFILTVKTDTNKHLWTNVREREKEQAVWYIRRQLGEYYSKRNDLSMKMHESFSCYNACPTTEHFFTKRERQREFMTSVISIEIENRSINVFLSFGWCFRYYYSANEAQTKNHIGQKQNGNNQTCSFTVWYSVASVWIDLSYFRYRYS